MKRGTEKLAGALLLLFAACGVHAVEGNLVATLSQNLQDQWEHILPGRPPQVSTVSRVVPGQPFSIRLVLGRFALKEGAADVTADLEQVNPDGTKTPIGRDLVVFRGKSDGNGVFLSRLMAVKNSAEADAAVVAGMYGGGVETLNNDGFRDPTHGTLMFFAGATDVQNAAAANTRIYGDGSQFTKKLYANGGEIGGFTISEDKLVSGNYDVGEEEMTLSKEKIRFRHKGTSGEVYIGVNNPVLPPSLGAISCLMSVENKNPSSDNRIGILIEVDGNLEALLPDRVNAAVWAESGSFVGFRPRSTYVESGQTNLDYLDSVVYVNTSSGNAVLTLPTNPQPDQMYMIRKLYAANSVSVGSSSHRIYLTGSDTPAYTATWTGRRAGIIQYNRTLNAWVLMFTFEA